MRIRDYRLGVWVAFAVAILGSSRAEAAITMDPNPVDVGDVTIGATGSTTGSLSSDSSVRVDLAIGPCSGGGGTFTVSPNADVNLNAAKTITVEFTPDASGIRQCTVYVYAKNTTNQLGTFAIRGNGQTPPTISVSDPPSFGSIRFNNTALTPSSSQNITVTNTGNQSLGVTNVIIGGTNAADFTITSGGTTGTISGNNGQKTWSVRFNPGGTTPGARSATMTFESNDPNTPSKVINLSGTATTAVIGVTYPTAHGIVAAGSQKSVDVIVASTAASNKGPLGVRSATITGSSWFSFSSCGSATTSCTFSPALSITTSSAIGIRCSPPAINPGTAEQTATVTFDSDTDAGGTSSVDVSCTPGISDLSASMTSVDFGSHLVGTSTMMTLTIENKGTSAANFYVDVTGVGANQFTVTGPNCGTPGNRCAIAATNGMVTLTLTFHPTLEGPLSAGVDIKPDNGVGPSITLAGRGVDKHVSVTNTLEFPETYRNPGSQAPLQSVTIANTGEYVLSVSDLSIVGDSAVWSLAAPFEAFTIDGLSSRDIDVRFAPVVEGKAQDGQLKIMTDDTAIPVATVTLSGNGKLRNVDLAPGSIDVGDTFAGIPTRLSIARPGELLTVVNQEEVTFTIASISISGDDASAFQLVDVSGRGLSNVALDGGAEEQFDIVFSPPHVGEFEATISVLLDEDTTPQQPVPIRGRAIYVGAHGSGGCSTGSGAGGATCLVLGLGLVLRRRRR